MTMRTQPHTGGELLLRAMELVTICRARDPEGEYPHVGDLQWWFGDPSLDDENLWRFWKDSQGQVVGVCLVEGNDITYVMHPERRNRDFEAEIRTWAIRLLEDHALQEGRDCYEINETACDDDPEKIALLEREGFVRESWHYLELCRSLDEPIPEPRLPRGYVIRNVIGEQELTERTALHYDSFHPHTSMTTEKYLRVMRTPGYDPQLDLMIVAPDGTPAAGCICWMDDVNKVGAFEPVGTRPAFRRRGLATALMLGGLRRLKSRGAVGALVGGIHPGDGRDKIPPEFTAARFVYQSVGFRPIRRVFRYFKRCQTGGKTCKDR